MSGFLTPWARLREFSDLGLVLPNAKLHTYVSGTPSTPLATYSDDDLTVLNTNPVVASPGGLFGPIYLTPGVAYKFLLTDEHDVTVPGYPQDPVTTSGINTAGLTNHGVVLGTGGSGLGVTGAGAVGQVLTSNGASADPTYQAAPGDNGLCDFRLTLTTGLPVTPADVLAATTLYLSPYKGNRIALYDAAGLATILTSAQVSIAVPATTAQLYDVFAFNNAGTVTLELLAWTNDTTRATALTLATTGVYTKTGDLTRRYLGSVRTTGVAGQTEDSKLKRFVWNYYHRVVRELVVLEATASWSYGTATWRQVRATAANLVEFLLGVAEDACAFTATEACSGGTGAFYTGVGLDSTTAPATGSVLLPQGPASSEVIGYAGFATVRPAAGYHYAAWLEKGGGGAATITGASETGLTGTVSG